MSLNRVSTNLKHKSVMQNQNGSAMVIAVFIIVVMAVLATSLNKNISSSASQVNNEVLGTRALFAAEAGNEAMLVNLFPVDGGAASCPLSEQRYLTTTGFSQCTVLSSCQEVIVEGTSYYSIQSKGVCKTSFSGDNSTPVAADANCTGADSMCVSRAVEVEAKAL